MAPACIRALMGIKRTFMTGRWIAHEKQNIGPRWQRKDVIREADDLNHRATENTE